MMGFFDERRVIIGTCKKLSGPRDNAIKEINAHRKVCAIDQSASLVRYAPEYLAFFRLPTRSSFNKRHFSVNASSNVSLYCRAHCKVDRHIMTAKTRR